MPEFVWRAASASGKVEQGRLSAASTAAALRQLREQGLTPLSLDDASSAGAAQAAVDRAASHVYARTGQAHADHCGPYARIARGPSRT